MRRTALCALLLAAAAAGCVPLPVQVAPPLAGRVVDAPTGAPLAQSLVVARVERRYDRVLPDRQLVGQRLVRTDSGGRFEVGRSLHPGLSVWPWAATDARVLAVAEGYRCSRPSSVATSAGELRIALEPASSPEDRRRSCRGLGALWEPDGEPPELSEALAEDGLEPGSPRSRRPAQADERTLAARAALGFGANCRGPVVDLALAPDGRRAAYAVLEDVEALQARGGAGSPEPARRAVYVVALDGGAPEAPARVSSGIRPGPAAELAWTTPDLLVLRAPGERAVTLWSALPPASLAREPAPGKPGAALHPEDRHDEDDARWLGRFFSMSREVHPATGLPRDLLHVTERDGSERTLTLPGEACAIAGRYGRPHYRIIAGGRAGLDLRHVEGGCHALRIDLANGRWSRLDTRDPRHAAAGSGTCRNERRVPPAQLALALRDYARELEARLAAASAGSAAYTIEIHEDGVTQVEATTVDGETHRFTARPFPIPTPLRLIHVSIVGGGRS